MSIIHELINNKPPIGVIGPKKDSEQLMRLLKHNAYMLNENNNTPNIINIKIKFKLLLNFSLFNTNVINESE